MSGETLLSERRRSPWPSTRALAIAGASAAAAFAGASMLAGTGGGPSALEVPLSWRLQGGRQRPDRAQLIAMAERDVGGLVRRIIAEEHRQVQAVHNRGRTFGKRGFRVARTPQLAARESAQIQPGSDDVVIGGRHFVQSQMLSAIDDFFDSDNNKLLVAQAIEEEALEAENGGQGEGTDVMAADALERLESGDTEFENEWANAGEKVVATASANKATHATYKYMIERDLGHSREEFNAAKAEADEEEHKLMTAQADLKSAEDALAAAEQEATDAEAAVASADEDIATAEAAQAALDAQAESDAQLAAECPEMAAALEQAGTAGQSFTDALEIVTDASGAYGQTSATTVDDVAAIGTAAEDVAATEGSVAAARASCLAAAGGATDDGVVAVPSALTIEEANAAKAEAEAALQAATAAVPEKEAEKAAAEAAVADQQALFDEKKAIQDAKQAIMDKLLDAHKALACDPHKLADVEPYTIEMQEAGACEFPASSSRVQYAVTQAEKAAEEARERAEIEGLMADKAWWQTALEELGDARPAIDQAQEAWDEAIAMKEAEAR